MTDNNIIAGLDALSDLDLDDDALDPYAGISDDRKDPTTALYFLDAPKVVQGKGKNAGKVSLLVEGEIAVEGFADRFGQDDGATVWITILDVGGKAPRGRNKRNNREALTIFGDVLGLEPTDGPEDMIEALKSGKVAAAFTEAKAKGPLEIAVTKWDGGLNIHPAPSDDE